MEPKLFFSECPRYAFRGTPNVFRDIRPTDLQGLPIMALWATQSGSLGYPQQISGLAKISVRNFQEESKRLSVVGVQSLLEAYPQRLNRVGEK